MAPLLAFLRQPAAAFNALSGAVLGVSVAVAYVHVFTIPAARTEAAQAATDAAELACAEDRLAAVAREHDLRLQVNRLETERNDTLAEIQARFASAQSAFEQEIARYEAERLDAGRGCVVGPDDLEWLRDAGTLGTGPTPSTD